MSIIIKLYESLMIYDLINSNLKAALDVRCFLELLL